MNSVVHEGRVLIPIAPGNCQNDFYNFGLVQNLGNAGKGRISYVDKKQLLRAYSTRVVEKVAFFEACSENAGLGDKHRSLFLSLEENEHKKVFRWIISDRYEGELFWCMGSATLWTILMPEGRTFVFLFIFSDDVQVGT